MAIQTDKKYNLRNQLLTLAMSNPFFSPHQIYYYKQILFVNTTVKVQTFT